MKATLKKTLRISLITLGALIVLLTSAIALAINFVFTPEKLTPVVVKAANQSLHARLDLDAVELTFFSTFPRFGLKLTDGTLVSKAIRDTLWERPDTLASFRRAVLVINPIDYLKQQKITLHRLALDSAKIYAYKHEDGRTNWDILPTDTTAVTPKDTSRTDTARLIREIDIRRVVLRHASLTFDDRETKIFANLWDVNLGLKAHLEKGHTTLALDWSNKNILFWQDGELLANHIATRLRRHKNKLSDHKGKTGLAEMANEAVFPLHETEDEMDIDVNAPLTIAETEANIPVCTVSEAVMYMDLVNEAAIMFRNSANNHISMVYRRKDGNIGWVEPKADN